MRSKYVLKVETQRYIFHPHCHACHVDQPLDFQLIEQVCCCEMWRVS